jgi:lysosomal Pro-X carboxypeptidase
MPMYSDGVRDMFYYEAFDYAAYNKMCLDTYGVRPDYDFALNFFGGVTDSEYLSSSRIMFTNGDLDPWSGASPNTNLSSELPSCLIRFGAHHLDLRPPNVLDPPDATKCRNEVLSNLKRWISQVKI